MNNAPGDVGGWFRTARAGVDVASDATAWGPDGGSFGRVSPDDDLAAALDLFRGRPTLVLTGAGMSTDSGLPDYRGRDAVPRSPMTFQEFVSSDLSRRRYWARSTVGWRAFGRARPNDAHLALAALGRLTPLTGIVTQNVDGLHQRAGSSPVVDLHGNLAEVICLGCGRLFPREDLQDALLRRLAGAAALARHDLVVLSPRWLAAVLVACAALVAGLDAAKMVPVIGAVGTRAGAGQTIDLDLTVTMPLVYLFVTFVLGLTTVTHWRLVAHDRRVHRATGLSLGVIPFPLLVLAAVGWTVVCALVLVAMVLFGQQLGLAG